MKVLKDATGQQFGRNVNPQLLAVISRALSGPYKIEASGFRV
jgi:hypothetical protein